MADMPRINKQLLLNETRTEINPRREVQLHLFGHVRPLRHPSRESLMGIALDNATRLATRHANTVYEGSKHHAKFGRAQRLAFARLLAGAYTWPALFDSRRGFVAARDAYRRKSVDRETGKIEYHKGVDSALYRLLEAGMTMTEISWLTRNLLLDHVEEIKGLHINEVAPATTAAQFYAERIRCGLVIIAKDLMQDDEKGAAVAHNVIFILYLGMRRELGDRAMGRFREALRRQGESPDDRQLRIALGRKDVREGLAEEPPVPLEQAMDMLYRPSTKVQPAFYDSLKRAEREPKAEAALLIQEVSRPQKEAVERGWREYVMSFFVSVRVFLKNLLG